jgi:hypothetical protein
MTAVYRVYGTWNHDKIRNILWNSLKTAQSNWKQKEGCVDVRCCASARQRTSTHSGTHTCPAPEILLGLVWPPTLQTGSRPRVISIFFRVWNSGWEHSAYV